MGRKRTASKGLPQHLYCRGGYYAYRHPIEGKEYGLGRNRLRAIMQANAANRAIRANSVATRIAEGLVTLLTEAEIVAGAAERDDLCGIYFLIRERRIVYVGQSKNIYKRIAEHAQGGEKPFDGFHFVQCSESILDEVEASYIALLQPKYNVVRNLRLARSSLTAFDNAPIQPREIVEPEMEAK